MTTTYSGTDGVLRYVRDCGPLTGDRHTSVTSQVAHTTGRSIAGARQVLRRLADEGRIRIERDGPQRIVHARAVGLGDQLPASLLPAPAGDVDQHAAGLIRFNERAMCALALERFAGRLQAGVTEQEQRDVALIAATLGRAAQIVRSEQGRT